jgi:RND family efflux transporter MFP subunit
VVLACGAGESTTDEAPAPADTASTGTADAEEVPVLRVELGTVPVTVTASGTVVARRVTEIVPEVQGRLIEVAVRIGDEVAEGDPLLRIDPAPFEMAAADARAGLALARAEAGNAASEAERIDQLADRDAASEQRVDQLRTQAAVARARVQQAEARLARAERDLALTVVRAPYTGTIVDRLAHEGAMAGATPALVIQESVALEVVLDVPEAADAPVSEGDFVTLEIEGLPRAVTTRVSSVSRRVAPDTRTYEVRAPVPDPDSLVKAGSYAQAIIETSPGEAAPVVPRNALLMREGRIFAFRVEGDRVVQTPIVLGRTGREAVEVRAGLAAGDEIVSGEAVARLGDGARIRPRRTPSPVAATGTQETDG